MIIRSSTSFLGIVGKDISYSLSPIIHNHFFSLHGIDCVYLCFDLPEKHLRSFLDIAWSLNAVGFNITKPYKECVADILGLQFPVNTLFRGPQGWHGANTDGIGFIRCLSKISKDIRDFDTICWLGCGGAAIAIIKEIFNFHPEVSHLILTRNKIDLPRYLSSVPYPKKIRMSKLCADELRRFCTTSTKRSLLVQASSGPQNGDDLSDYSSCLTHLKGPFVDLIYDCPSELYFQALRLNLPALNGEALLVEQARSAQEIWFRKSLTFDEAQTALKLHESM